MTTPPLSSLPSGPIDFDTIIELNAGVMMVLCQAIIELRFAPERDNQKMIDWATEFASSFILEVTDVMGEVED